MVLATLDRVAKIAYISGIQRGENQMLDTGNAIYASSHTAPPLTIRSTGNLVADTRNVQANITEGNELNEHQKAAHKVQQMSEDALSSEWDALRHYDPQEQYAPGVPMDDWALLVASERSRRAAIARRKAMEADIQRLQGLEEKFRLA